MRWSKLTFRCLCDHPDSLGYVSPSVQDARPPSPRLYLLHKKIWFQDQWINLVRKSDKLRKNEIRVQKKLWRLNDCLSLWLQSFRPSGFALAGCPTKKIKITREKHHSIMVQFKKPTAIPLYNSCLVVDYSYPCTPVFHNLDMNLRKNVFLPCLYSRASRTCCSALDFFYWWRNRVLQM